MGHERVGMLPKTKRWRQILDDMSMSDMSSDEVADVAKRTLTNVRDRYRNIMFDSGVKAAIQFLIIFAVSTRASDPGQELRSFGISIGSTPTPVAVTRAAHDWVDVNRGSLEYGQIARCAAGDAIVSWYQHHQPKQPMLFTPSNELLETWQKTGSGAGFCELSRLFFAKFTERYLNYFLERELSAVVSVIDDRVAFEDKLSQHVNEISEHAFETAKITQSFAAGWFNKNTRDGIPDDSSIEGFLRHSFEKMREELLREGTAQ